MFCAECLEGWSRYGDHCYQGFKTKHQWEGARKACLLLNADLVSISSQAENDFVETVMKSLGIQCAWIGLTRVSAGYVDVLEWSDGTPFTFRSFRSDEPSGGQEHCVALEVNKDWNDVECLLHNYYVCEKRGEWIRRGRGVLTTFCTGRKCTLMRCMNYMIDITKCPLP